MTIEIKFDYEYECGGHVYTHYIDIDKEEFENDTLLVLVCAYMQSWGGYPGGEIDKYLHNRFPNNHTTEDMFGHGYNVYDCHVDDLKPFYEVADILLSMDSKEAEQEIERLCKEFNNEHKGKSKENMSIWEN